MEVPRLGVESELQLLAWTTTTATWDPRRIRDLPTHWIINPLSEARNQTHILMDISQILNPLSYDGNSYSILTDISTFFFLLHVLLKMLLFQRNSSSCVEAWLYEI